MANCTSFSEFSPLKIKCVVLYIIVQYILAQSLKVGRNGLLMKVVVICCCVLFQSLVCLNGDIIRKDTINAMAPGNAKFLMDSVFELAQRMNHFRLSDAEIGLFCAVVIITPGNTLLQCLKITQNVAFEFLEFWHFSPIFVLLKLTCLVTLFDRKLQVFKHLTKMDHFWHF